MTTQVTRAEPRFLVDPPTPCMAKLNKLEWAATSTFDVDGTYIGVRSSDAELDTRLRRALRAHHAANVATAPNFSLLLADRTARGAGAGFNLLYRSSSSVLRTRDPRRLTKGLVNHLAGFAPLPTALLQIQGVALVGTAGAVVAPAALHQWLDVVERRLRQHHVRIVDAPFVLVDPEHHEVVVAEPNSIEVDWAELDGIEHRTTTSRPDPPVEPGRYPLVGWAFFAGPGDTAMPRARAVALAAQRTLNAHAYGLQPTLSALAALMRDITPVALRWTNPAAEATTLARLA